MSLRRKDDVVYDSYTASIIKAEDAKEPAAGSHTDARSAGIGTTAPITALENWRWGTERQEGEVGVVFVTKTSRQKARWCNYSLSLI